MSKVYLVTDGDYSDYRVLGVYSSMEKAEHAKLLYAADNDVEEYELDAVPESPPGLLAYVVIMELSGDVSHMWQESVKGFKSRWHPGDPYGSAPVAWFRIWARDEQHAVKIANEWRAQIIAMGLWDPHNFARVACSYSETELVKLYRESCQTQPET